MAATDEITVNSEYTGDQTEPRVLQNNAGVTCVTWYSLRSYADASGDPATARGVKAQLFAADGSRIGDEFWITSEGQRFTQKQICQRYSDGAFIVHLVNDTTKEQEIKAISPTDGAVTTQTIFIGEGNAKPSHVDSVYFTTLIDGGAVLAWESDDYLLNTTGAGTDIYVQLLSDGFEPIGAPQRATFDGDTVSGNQTVEDMIALSDGGFAIAINSDYDPVTGDPLNSAFIAAFGPDLAMRSNYTALPESNSAGTVFPPKLLAKSDGTFVAYRTSSYIYSMSHVGNILSTNTTAVEGYSSLPGASALLDSGRFLIGAINESEFVIHSANTAIYRTDIALGTYTDATPNNTTFATAIDGGAIAVWDLDSAEEVADQDGHSIMMRRFSKNGTPVEFGAPYESDFVPIGEIGTGDGTDGGSGGDGTDGGSGGGGTEGGVSTDTCSDGKHLTIKISVPICCSETC